MTDTYNIDSHKLVYHPARVAEWLKGNETWDKAKSIYPIYMEVSPIGICNHRCVFCAVDYVGYENRSLDKEIFRERLTEMAEAGVKSIMFAGEGEPTLWKPLPEILGHCTKIGIDTALTTNMVPFTERNFEAFIGNCSWIKTSINAGTAETYAKIHRTRAEDFGKVMNNFMMCVEKRKEKSYSCAIGAQMVLLPENAHEAVILAEKLKAIGIDYLVIKPYSQHLSSVTRKYEDLNYRSYLKLEKQLEALNGDNFNIIFRKRTMSKLFEAERSYQQCSATPFFWAYIMSDGCVYGCSAFLCNDKFNYGNIHKAGFKEIWEGEKRRLNYEYIKNEMKIDECRKNCRMDEINRYLWKLKFPDLHVNFI